MASLPDFLLDHILIHLPLLDLMAARLVSRTWNETILSRQRFRRRLFLQPPTINTQFLYSPVVLHPVLHQLQSDWSVSSVPVTVTSPPPPQPEPPEYLPPTGEPLEVDSGEWKLKMMVRGKLLEHCAVKEHYATEPALEKFVINLPICNICVRRKGGVRVWDVAMGVKKLFGEMARIDEDHDGDWCGITTLHGFRQTNRMLNKNINRKFIPLFRYDY